MIGTIAGILTTLAFLPQVIKVLQTKDTKAISLGMYLMSVTGIFLWMLHGYRIGDMALFIANVVTFCLALVILIAKLKYK
ncbi:SemiSWEET transporter [Trichococcus sp. K1Tr]|jgi:MtN3 and saliva related transmembrane protein|uniref:SemiSWEET family sugar transporter n=1 Tax=Trichococcus sp. K1Tr TaxID=3020847 RepID=UPI00232D3A7F|nr:SemiSWEET transporter [Trichococcus sp. K1Tr]MDB6354616.1 SemiSWEET transporter [Trichococcus sp. K1Tr]